MFFLGYLRSELVRRKSRTILTVLGLAVGVSLVIAVSALSRGLDEAQAKALEPALEHRHRPDRDARAADAGRSQGGGFGGRRVRRWAAR